MIKKILIGIRNGRIAGHPVHVMLVHFPSALFPVSVFLDWIAFYLNSACLGYAAFYTLAIGIISALAAAIFGAIDYAKLPSVHPAWNTASLHALLNITWLILFTIAFGLRFKHFHDLNAVTSWELAIETFSVLGLIYSNYLGGELVFKHKLSIND